ncbi:Hypothetical predicted protein [Cloeon dipterum]|uniref:Ribosomal RNA-processing protein 8 n=3 Tax=Cloeon dipterum TaxID=197152 RepID=A0A8S1CF39_9INSE|nr:Hypothetical predicted protein [Cloeon dipterum]
MGKNRRKNAKTVQKAVGKEQKFKVAKHKFQNMLKEKTKPAKTKTANKKIEKVKEWVNETNKIELTSKKNEAPTSLRERMMERLHGAHFRFLNEQLYTAEGSKSIKMFTKNPEAFTAYHEGFQQQVQQWEFNPLDLIIANIKKKGSDLVIADFGCGDARLSFSVQNKVHSFDLVAMNDNVTVCDMAHTPLPNSSVDIAVFCLSLMGTNLSEFILEANRVLKPGGTLKIAEVESRFDGEKGLNSFIYGVTKHGFKLASKNLSKTYFCFLDFKKTLLKDAQKKLPQLKLKPCMYKKR